MSAVKQIFPTVPLRYIIRKVNKSKKCYIHLIHSYICILGSYWCIYILFIIIVRTFTRSTYSPAIVNPSSPTSFVPLIHVPLDPVADLVCSMRVCAISMVWHIGWFKWMHDWHLVVFNCLWFAREEIAWDIDTIYLSHDTRILNLRDFDHLESKWVESSCLSVCQGFTIASFVKGPYGHCVCTRVQHIFSRP